MMKNRTEIPKRPRYAFVRKQAYKLLLDMHITQLPLDIFDILSTLGVYVFSKTFFIQNAGNRCCIPFEHSDCEALTYYVRDEDTFLMFYDDTVKNKERIYWTLAHELGHIVLGHLTDFSETVLSRNEDMTDDKYSCLESEANFFASLILAPDEVLYGMKVICPSNSVLFDEKLLQQSLCLSVQASQNRYTNFLRSFKRIENSIENRQSQFILRNFFDFIISISDSGSSVHHSSFNIADDTRMNMLSSYKTFRRSIKLKDDTFEVTADADKNFLPYEYKSFLLYRISRQIEAYPTKADTLTRSYTSLLYSRISIDLAGNPCILCDDELNAYFLLQNKELVLDELNKIEDANYKKIYISYVDFKSNLMYNVQNN